MATEEKELAVQIQSNDEKANPASADSTESASSKPKLPENFDEVYDIESVNDAIKKFLKREHEKKYPRPFLDYDLLFESKNDFWHSKVVPPETDDEWEAECIGSKVITKAFRRRHGITKNFAQRLRRATFAISTVVVCLILASLIHIHVSVMIGVGLLAMFTLYMSQVLWYTLSARDSESKHMALYRVYSVSDKPNYWANLNTAYLQLIYDKESVQSISELSAIHGGVTKTMLNTLGAYTWSAISIHFIAQLYYNRCVFSWDIVDYFMICGTGGILMISIFELDPFSHAMITCHYIGVAFAALCPAGYVIQQYFIFKSQETLHGIIIAGVLYVVAVMALSLFMLSGFATDEAQKAAKDKWSEDNTFKLSRCMCLVPGCLRSTKEKPKGINTYSKMNIVFEATAIYLVTVALCLWMIQYDKDCKYGCAGAWEHCPLP